MFDAVIDNRNDDMELSEDTLPQARRGRPRKQDKAPARTLEEIIEAAKAGDQQAFSQLYELHKRRVYWLCQRMTHNLADAEDLTQETFLQVHRKLHTYRGESAFSTWLHRVAVNVVLMRIRKKRMVETSLDELMEPGPQQDSKPKELGAEDIVLSGSMDRLVLERAIDELPPGYRLTFLLHDVYGYEHGEIAAILGCTVGNCKSQLHKGRLKLKSLLGKTARAGRLPSAA